MAFGREGSVLSPLRVRLAGAFWWAVLGAAAVGGLGTGNQAVGVGVLAACTVLAFRSLILGVQLTERRMLSRSWFWTKRLRRTDVVTARPVQYEGLLTGGLSSERLLMLRIRIIDGRRVVNRSMLQGRPADRVQVAVHAIQRWATVDGSYRPGTTPPEGRPEARA